MIHRLTATLAVIDGVVVRKRYFGWRYEDGTSVPVAFERVIESLAVFEP